MPSTFAAILEDRLKHIEDAAALIEKGEGSRPELDSLRANLIDILDQVERNPGIEAAADDLYEVGAGVILQGSRESRSTRDRRLLQDRLSRFKERLASALPKPKSVP